MAAARAIGSIPADIVSVAQEKVSVVLENDWVRALLFDMEAGSELPLHQGSDRVVYSLSDYTLEWTEGDAPAVEKTWAAGQAHWHAAGPHAARNAGAGAARFLVVERSAAPLPAEEEAESVPAAPEHGQVLLENEAVRVVEVVLEPGESTTRHPGGNRLIYSLSDYTIRWTEGDAQAGERSWSEGEAHWHGPAAHEAENTGETAARYLVMTLLR